MRHTKPIEFAALLNLMPVETIKCQECGSADVTEFKAGSYVCGHCDAIFRTTSATTHATCACGRNAIGVCTVCGIPVCEDHSREIRGSSEPGQLACDPDYTLWLSGIQDRCFACGRATSVSCPRCQRPVCNVHIKWETVEVATGERIGLANVYRSQTRLRDRCVACDSGQPVDGVARLEAATDLEEIGRLLREGTFRRLTPAADKTGFAFAWREAVEATWRRLSEAGTLGPPTHDIATVRCLWHKYERVKFEELSRQPGWLVPDAVPYVFREGLEIIKESRGRMDVWIAADGQTFRREEVFRADRGTSRADHDAKLTYHWSNGTAQHPVTVAVPVGEPPRTEEKRGFLLPTETKALQHTILLTEKGSRDSHHLDHDLGTALSALIVSKRRVPA